jgi:hypothetical protein
VKDTRIVTIYDLENGGKPLQAHRIDAMEFLKHPRWSTSPEGNKAKDLQPLEVKEDSGKAMQLKEMDFKTLQAMANKAGIPAYGKMNKAALVAALENTQ